jgi:hypothetical protein
MLFHGPPGVGKTMLAERVPGLLPDLDIHDALGGSAVHSLAGFNLADELITRPPYSDPHHSASVASIVGGSQRMAKLGAISCGHKGVLFLDTPKNPIHQQATHVRTDSALYLVTRCPARLPEKRRVRHANRAVRVSAILAVFSAADADRTAVSGHFMRGAVS